VLIQSNTDEDGVTSEAPISFARADLEKFKLQFDLNLKLDLPIKLPAVVLKTTTAFDFCQLVSSFQKILKGGLGAVSVVADAGTQLNDVAAGSSSTGSSDSSDSESEEGTFSSLRSRASNAASSVADSASNVAGKAFSTLDKIADLVNFVLQKPVDVFVEVLVFLVDGIKTCDTLSASFAAQGGVNPLQAPLLLSLSVPPSPAKPVLTLTVKDTFSVCALAGALRAAASQIQAHLEEDAAEVGESSSGAAEDGDFIEI